MDYLNAYFYFKLVCIVVAPCVFLVTVGILYLYSEIQRWWHQLSGSKNKE